MASRKSHSNSWNNHTSPRNSRWLSENLEEMDRLTNEMLRLIEADGDSFAKKAEMYYQSRPELISHVKDFHSMYRALAQRYDHATGDLSSNWSEAAASSSSLPSSPGRTPEHKVNPFKPQRRAAGFDFFLGSDRSRKGSDESSESGSECDYSKIMEEQQDLPDHEESLLSVLEDRAKQAEAENAELMRNLEKVRLDVEARDERISKLEDELERQKGLIMDEAEGKREAIRQLCFSIDHYRAGYQQLCRRLRVHNRSPSIIA